MSGSNTRSLDFGEAFRFGWKAFFRNAPLFIASLLTLAALWGALELFTFELDARNWGLAVKMATHLLYLILNAGLWLGLFNLALSIAEGKKTPFSLLFSNMRQGPAFFIGQLAFTLAFLGGALVLIIPGFYFAGRLLFFPFKMAEGGRGLVKAFQASLDVTNGLEWAMTRLWAILFLFNIIGAALLGVGILITLPVSLITLARVYKQIKSPK